MQLYIIRKQNSFQLNELTDWPKCNNKANNQLKRLKNFCLGHAVDVVANHVFFMGDIEILTVGLWVLRIETCTYFEFFKRSQAFIRTYEHVHMYMLLKLKCHSF